MEPVGQGLAGLTAYGIIILVNDKLSDEINKRMASGHVSAALAVRDFLYLWGILFLGGVIGHIIILSEIVPLKLHDYAIITITALVLAGPIVAFHLSIFKSSFEFLKKKELTPESSEHFISTCYATWVFAYIGFIITADLVYMLLWTIAPVALLVGSILGKYLNSIRILLALLTLSAFILSFFTN